MLTTDRWFDGLSQDQIFAWLQQKSSLALTMNDDNNDDDPYLDSYKKFLYAKISRAKGVHKHITANMTFKHYEKCLEEYHAHHANMTSLRGKNHVIKVIRERKCCYSSFDDKIYLCPNGIHFTFHFGIEAQKAAANNQCEQCDKKKK